MCYCVIMYSYKFAVFLCVVVIVKANDDFRLIDSIYQENPCTSQGGICTIAADCPKGHLVNEKGLCPSQRHKGVECCWGLSVKETRCEKRGGSCLSGPNPCNEVVKFRDATDCPTDTTCCILVR